MQELIDEFLATLSDQDEWRGGVCVSDRAMAGKYLSQFAVWLEQRNQQTR